MILFLAVFLSINRFWTVALCGVIISPSILFLFTHWQSHFFTPCNFNTSFCAIWCFDFKLEQRNFRCPYTMRTEAHVYKGEPQRIIMPNLVLTDYHTHHRHRNTIRRIDYAPCRRLIMLFIVYIIHIGKSEPTSTCSSASLRLMLKGNT